MSDPTLKRSSVRIVYSASDGYRSEVTYSSIGRMGIKPPPEAPILEAIEELARLSELFGFGERAATAVAEAQCRVREWRARRGGITSATGEPKA
jgi:hypothetical protein